MGTTVITGASGFLGSHVAETLISEGGDVLAMLRPTSSPALVPAGCPTARVDFMDPSSMEEAVSGAGVIVHAAGATSAVSQEEFDRANALVTRNMLAARNMYAKDSLFIYISSQAASGPSGCGPVTAYGRSKLLGELAVKETGNWVIVRPPAIFGPGDPASAPVLRMALKGLFFSPWMNRGGFCLVFARDLARLTADLPDFPDTVGKTLEPSYGRLYSWKDFHRILERASGRRILHVRVPPLLVQAAGFMNEALSSFVGRTPFFCREKCRELLACGWEVEDGLTRRLTGWEPSLTVEEAMAETLRWVGGRG
ncbi:MAG: NAD-dependent epimerase/dehydratase family protein [Candidatus Aegiribacteria sp.]